MQTLIKKTNNHESSSYDRKIHISVPQRNHHIQSIDKNVWMPQKTANAILRAAAESGIDIREVFHSEGASYQGKADAANLSKVQFFNIFKRLSNAISDVLHQRNGHSQPVFDDDLLFSCIMNGRNLEDVIEKLCKFFKSMKGSLITPDIELVEQNVVFSINSKLRKNDPHAALIDMLSLSHYYKLFSWLITESISPSKMTLIHSRAFDQELIDENIDCPVQYDCGSNAIVFGKKFLKKPVRRTYHELYDSLITRFFEFTPNPPTTSVATYIENLFRKILATKSPIPNSDQIASSLGKSGQTLRRHLAMENTSYQYLLDKCRIEKSMELLQETDLTLDEISELLGFSAGSGFSRAFKNWTGNSPSTFRLQAKGKMLLLAN